MNTRINRLTAVGKLVSLVLLLTACSSVLADNIITGGTTLKLLSGTKMVSVGSLTIQNTAVINNAGTLILKKDLVNQNSGAVSLGTGTIEMSGTTTQTISGQNIIQDLVVNNSTGVNIGGTTTVNGILTFTSGRVDLGTNNLVLGPSAAIGGSPSAAAMIVATGTGEIRKEYAAAGSFTFPVGDATGTAEYSPVTIVFSAGTFASGNYVAIKLANAKYSDPNITGNYLNRYWVVTQSGITGFSANATFQYVAADVTGDETKIACTKVNPLPWVTYALTNSSTHVMTASGLTAFSTFTGVRTTTPPENNQVSNVTIPSGLSTCYDATQTLTMAGNGTTFIVQNGGEVTLVAGHNVLLEPGASVQPGGYLHAYITTTASYCGAMLNPLVASIPPGEGDVTTGLSPEIKNQLIKVYPNPTTDLVFVELLVPVREGKAIVTVYNMQGSKLYQTTLNGEVKCQFSLLDKPVGIYLVRVQAGEQGEVAKVVKAN